MNVFNIVFVLPQQTNTELLNYKINLALYLITKLIWNFSKGSWGGGGGGGEKGNVLKLLWTFCLSGLVNI